MKVRAFKITLIVLASAILCAFLPFEERVESVDLLSVYRAGQPSAKQLLAGDRILWLEHKQFVFDLFVGGYMDMSVAKTLPRTFDEHQVAASPLGEIGIITRSKEDPSNLKRGTPIGYPCRLFFRRGNVFAYVAFKKPDKGIHWPEEVNRLSDAEQIALLEEVGRVLDKAIVAKNPGVHVIKWSFADTCRVKLEALRLDLWNYIFGGGS